MTETNGEAPYAPLRERLAPLCGVVVAIIAQVVMRDRIVLGPPYLAPVIEIALVVVLVLVLAILWAVFGRKKPAPATSSGPSEGDRPRKLRYWEQ